MQLLIYTPKLTPRIMYIFSFIFHEILKSEFLVTTSEQELMTHSGPKFAYADKQPGDVLFFRQAPLLLGNRISDVNLETTTFGEVKVPFPVKGSALPFDVFAASFFIVTRYEEYLHQRNKGTTFLPENSLQSKLKLLNNPVVDDWALLIKNIIQSRYPAFKAGDKDFRHLPVIHSSLPAKRADGLAEKGRQIFRSLLKKDSRAVLFDNLAGLGNNQDQNLQYLNSTFRSKNLIPFYFLDGNWDDFSTEDCRLFLSKIQTTANFGFLSTCEQADKRTLKKMIDVHDELPVQNPPVTQQLELSMPGCYLQLLKGGISTDFSMGYHNTCGFRAGTCTPFYWYDLQLEHTTDLKIYPYAISDKALQQRNMADAEKLSKRLIDRIKLVNGTFCSTWSMKSLSENVKFKKWRGFYESILTYAGN